MQVPVYDIQGKVVDRIEVSDEVFDTPINSAVMHQAMVRQLANLRQGTVATKTRGMISGGGRKPFKQKGTGRARQGSTRAPQFRGGGIAFGPQPRSYAQAMPRKMRRLALRSALSSKVEEEQLVIVDALTFAEPKTREMQAIIEHLPVVMPLLIVTPDSEENVYKSARNIPKVTTLPANNINVVDVLRHSSVVMSVAAVRRIEKALVGDATKKEEVQAESQTPQ